MKARYRDAHYWGSVNQNRVLEVYYRMMDHTMPIIRNSLRNTITFKLGFYIAGCFRDTSTA